MGLLIDGVWHDQWYDTKKHKGEFVRENSRFHNWVTEDGRPGPTGKGGFAAEPGRYHLYVSYACPWAHRTLIFRVLKKLQDIVSVSIVHPHMLENGWEYSDRDGATLDDVNGFSYHHQLYTAANPQYTGRCTVPVLWDKKNRTIVNNESSEIIRMFNSAFNALTEDHIDYYPEALRAEIDAVNKLVYENINNGVYRCGFATSQQAYERAFDRLFAALDQVEERLARQRYLAGNRLTEADWRLFTSLLRFDAVYVGHFKCNLRRIGDYPNLSNYLRDLYQYPGIAETVNMEHIKQHYYYSHHTINPSQIVPKGTEIKLQAPHNRDRFDLWNPLINSTVRGDREPVE